MGVLQVRLVAPSVGVVKERLFSERALFLFRGYNSRMTVEIRSLEELAAEAARFARGLEKNEGGATLVTLSGELGAGKTAFVKEVAKTFGVEDSVTSPTFVLEKIYTLARAPFKRLVHIDAYRLEGGNELTPLAIPELMRDSDNLILLEWPEKVADGLPQAQATLSFIVNPDGTRTISYA